MIEVKQSDEAMAHTAVGLLELAALNGDDTAERVIALCERALTPVGNVAAVCVLPRFAGLARRTLDILQATDIRVVASVNFPSGSASVETIESQTQGSLLAGADEIDLVFPFHAHIGGDKNMGSQVIAACKARCGRRGALTVTLETGVLRDPQIIHQVSRMAIREGADFLKTSTGKQRLGTTPQAARIMLEAIAELGAPVGLKACAEVRTLAEARIYLDMVDTRFGAFWQQAGRLRLGAASLLDDLLLHLGIAP